VVYTVDKLKDTTNRKENNMNIMQLTGMAWHSAIENVIERLSRNSFRILTFRNDWRMAQEYAIERNIKFDFNGNIVD
jgi:hypothetical protein